MWGRSLLVVSSVVVMGCSGGPGAADAGLPVSARYLSLDCPKHGIGGYTVGRTLMTGGRLGCTVRAGDRTGAPLAGVGATFLSEAGRMLGGGVTSSEGLLALEHEVSLPLPIDVAPVVYNPMPVADATHTGVPVAPSWMQPQHWNRTPVTQNTSTYSLEEPRRPDPIRRSVDGGFLTNNPRDNLVTLVAIVRGEEAFTDDNANGVFDVGEPFVDLTEPFVDANDDGTRNEGEAFVDVNDNQLWDGRNGVWDSSTQIWAQERVLWSGITDSEDVMIVVPGVAGHWPTIIRDMTRSSFVCPPATSDCPFAQPVGVNAPETRLSVSIYMADPWFNPMVRIEGAPLCEALEPELLPVVAKPRFEPGVSERAAWPAGDRVWFTLEDVRLSTDGGVLPRRSPPVSFKVSVRCSTIVTDASGKPLELTWGDAFQGSIE